MQINDTQKMAEFAKGIDQYLSKMEDFTSGLKDARQLVRAIQEHNTQSVMAELAAIREEIAHIREHIGIQPINVYERNLGKIKEQLFCENWPTATSDYALGKDEQSLIGRADDILNLFIIQWLTNTRFLDFGCGDGYVTGLSVDRLTKLSVGYDLVKPTWNKPHEKLLFTQDFKEVEKNAPYDVILLYDVLDHLVGDHIDTLKKIRSLLSPLGKVYVRNHPWCSINGGHCYHQINKAYIHLLFDSIELTRIGGFSEEPNIIHLTKPCEHYRYWFEKAGFDIKDEHINVREVPGFFTDPKNTAIRERLKKHWGNDDPFVNMRMQFVDYTLMSKESNYQVI